MKSQAFEIPNESDIPGAAVPGCVYVVGAGPGDPGLLTVRGAELIATADVILHDGSVHAALLARAVGRGAEVRRADPADGAEVQALACAGRRVVVLEGGDPLFLGGGAAIARALAAAGIAFEVVPGVPAPSGAAAYAGIPLAGASVLFADARGAIEGASLARADTLALLVDAASIDAVCAQIAGAPGLDPAAPAAVIQRGSTPEQRVVEGTLGAIAGAARAAGFTGDAVLVVGSGVAQRGALRWFDARPLFGKRVLVTRPKGQAAATAERLRRRGAEPIEMPAIVIGPPPDPARVTEAARALDRYDVVAFTSENGVDWFFRELDAQRRDARAFGRARLAAIGTGTAAALATRGVRADIVPAEFRGEGLAEAILADRAVADRLAQGGRPRVLVPRALVAREVLAERLCAAGCEVDVVPVYETRAASVERRDDLVRRLDEGGVDVVMLTSSSTADSLCDLLGPRAPELLRRVLVASIGPITTATAEKRGLTVGVTAAESTTLGLIAAIERRLAAG